MAVRTGFPGRLQDRVHEVVVRVEALGLLAFGVGLGLEVLDGPLLLFDDALPALDLRVEVRALALPARVGLFLGGRQRPEVRVQCSVERVEGLTLQIGVLLEGDWRDVDRGVVLSVQARLGVSLPQPVEQRTHLLVEPLVVPLVGVLDRFCLLHARTRAQLLRVGPTEVQLRRERADHVGVRLGHRRAERVLVHRQRVDPRLGIAVGRPRRDGSGPQADRRERVDHLPALVEHRQVPLAEQLRHDFRVLVAAAELEGEDPIEAVLGDPSEVSPGDAVAQHLREVRRALRRGRDEFGIRDVDPLLLADSDEQLDPPPVEVPHLEPHEVVLVAVGLVHLRAGVGPQLPDQGDQAHTRDFPLGVHVRIQSDHGVRTIGPVEGSRGMTGPPKAVPDSTARRGSAGAWPPASGRPRPPARYSGLLTYGPSCVYPSSSL